MKKANIAAISVLVWFLVSCSTPTVEVPNNGFLITEINHYYMALTLPVDLSWAGQGVVQLPFRNLVNMREVKIVDKVSSGNELTVIARIPFQTSNGRSSSSNGKAVLTYFRKGSLSEDYFDADRKFLFRRYDSGTWRLEKELME